MNASGVLREIECETDYLSSGDEYPEDADIELPLIVTESDDFF